MVDYVNGLINVHYACHVAPWKKILGYRVRVYEEESVTYVEIDAPAVLQRAVEELGVEEVLYIDIYCMLMYVYV